MIKIFTISDLHLEFYKSDKSFFTNIKDKLVKADILILAGDIGYPDKHYATHYLHLLQSFKQIYPYVILVPGNHEYYTTKNYNIIEQQEKLSKICNDAGVILLNNSSVNINNIKFIGTTLWSQINNKAFDSMNDKNNIFKNAKDYNDEHKKCVEWLKQEIINSENDDKIIIITHHLPTFKLCHPKFENNYINSGFYTEILHDLNIKDNVKYWIAGHTHEYINTKINNINFIINPMGYPYENRDTLISYEPFII